MSLLDWLNMGLVFDIGALVFIIFYGYKIRKLSISQKRMEENLKEVIRNPAAAKRRLRRLNRIK